MLREEGGGQDLKKVREGQREKGSKEGGKRREQLRYR